MNWAIFGFALGVWLCQQQAELVFWAWPALGAVALLGVLWPVRRNLKPRLVLLTLTSCLIGLSYASWRGELRLSERLVDALEGQDIRLAGVVADLPQTTERGIRFLFQVDSPDRGIPRLVSLSWYAQGKSNTAPPPVRAGERWMLTVRLRQPHGSMNPDGFDYEGWLFERGIGGLGYVRPDPGNHRTDLRAAGIWPAINTIREVIRDRFQRVLPDSAVRGVLVALVVGDQASITREQWNLFGKTAVNHLMSISGSHVTLFGAMVAFCVAALWRRSQWLTLRVPVRKAALLGGTLAAGFYVLLAGCGVPAQRTVYMLGVATLSLWIGRGNEPLRILLIALLLVLLIDPWAVLSAGFWLSFGAVGALLLMTTALSKEDRGLIGWLTGWLRAQWVVTVLTLPMLLALFQQFSLVSPLANAVAIPAIGAVITPLSLVFACIPVPSVAEFANWLLGWLMVFLQWCAALPLSAWQQAAPPLWLATCAVLAAIWSLLPKGTPGRWAGLLIFLPLLGWQAERPAEGEVQVNVLDVGQGLAVHVRTAHHDLLYDAGPRYTSESDSGDRIVVPYLRAAGADQLDAFLVSHDDLDHAGGADSVLSAIPVSTLLGSFSTTQRAGAAIRSAMEKTPCEQGRAWRWDDVEFSILSPAAGDITVSDNNHSCVLRITASGRSALLPGDIEQFAEERLLNDLRPALHADVLVAPHHGSKSSSTQAFIEAVGASYVVFTSGYRNRFNHPAPSVVQRYRDSGASLFRSDADGAVLFHLSAQGIQTVTMRAKARRYWHDRAQ